MPLQQRPLQVAQGLLKTVPICREANLAKVEDLGMPISTLTAAKSSR